jgi:hypothetical protein
MACSLIFVQPQLEVLLLNSTSSFPREPICFLKFTIHPLTAHRRELILTMNPKEREILPIFWSLGWLCLLVAVTER